MYNINWLTLRFDVFGHTDVTCPCKHNDTKWNKLDFIVKLWIYRIIVQIISNAYEKESLTICTSLKDIFQNNNDVRVIQLDKELHMIVIKDFSFKSKENVSKPWLNS